ncbi:beta-lactamase [Fibrella aestuarina BUZ 2]|uniref:Beta-lactamase n=1 Tax=Fibrella aestuarina BUZ 2 TaxID=1166018 RepID=I0KGH9_9BACT|nr:class A beta-lactamase [Fibrella aestuarina]CCH03232.1 beta-lactamase [Fibrella aestuarina BUZ 2]
MRSSRLAMHRIASIVGLVCLCHAVLAQPPKRRETNFVVKQSDMQAFMKKMGAEAKGRVGVAAAIVETGESIAYAGTERFPMQSVYKLPIAMATLAAIDAGTIRRQKPITVGTGDYVGPKQHSPLRDQHPSGATVSIDELLRYAVSESDGSASDVLLRLVGGASSVQSYLRTIGVTGVMVRNTERELGSADSVQYANWATPVEMVSLLRQLQLGRGLSDASRTYLLKLMTDTATGPNRLKGQLPPGTLVAHKTGTSMTVDGKTAATNDVGLITLPSGKHLAIAVFVSDARADQATRERVIAQITKQLWNRWQ